LLDLQLNAQRKTFTCSWPHEQLLLCPSQPFPKTGRYPALHRNNRRRCEENDDFGPLHMAKSVPFFRGAEFLDLQLNAQRKTFTCSWPHEQLLLCPSQPFPKTGRYPALHRNNRRRCEENDDFGPLQPWPRVVPFLEMARVLEAEGNMLESGRKF